MRRRRDRLQPDGQRREQPERIEVVVAAASTEVQTARRQAVRAHGDHRTQDRAGLDVLSCLHLRHHRLVGRPQVTVVNGDDTDAGHLAGVRHRPRFDSEHGLTRRRAEVDAAVPGQPRRLGWVERADQRRKRCERPLP